MRGSIQTKRMLGLLDHCTLDVRIVFILDMLVMSGFAFSQSSGNLLNRQTRSVSSALYQVFPLAHRLHYVYDYKYSYTNYDGGLDASEIETDTGRVEYTILDSSIESDSAVNWSVREVSVLWVSVWEKDSNMISTSSDTVNTTLRESLSGLHRLTMSSKVWNFPLTDSGLYVYRYSDSPSIVAKNSSYQQGNGAVPSFWDGDSLLLINGEGPSRLYNSSGQAFSPYFSQSSVTTAIMIGNPVLNVEKRNAPPASFVLEQNYPNPFNPTTTISYQLPAVSHVTLIVYDVLGREVRTLVNEKEEAGTYTVTFDGSQLASGMYFYRLKAGNSILTQKMMVLK